MRRSRLLTLLNVSARICFEPRDTMTANHGKSHAAAILITLLGLIFGTSCVMQGPADTHARQNNGVIVVQSDVDAIAIIDGGGARTLPAGQETPLPVTPGEHRVEITSQNHLPRRFDVDVEANEAVIIEVQMWPRVDEVDGAE